MLRSKKVSYSVSGGIITSLPAANDETTGSEELPE